MPCFHVAEHYLVHPGRCVIVGILKQVGQKIALHQRNLPYELYELRIFLLPAIMAGSQSKTMSLPYSSLDTYML